MGDDQVDFLIDEILFHPLSEVLQRRHIAGNVAEPDRVGAQLFRSFLIHGQEIFQVSLFRFFRCGRILQPPLGDVDQRAVCALPGIFENQRSAHQLGVQRMGADADDALD